MSRLDTPSRLLIELLRSEINSTPPVPNLLPADADMWQQVFMHARRHGVAALVLNAISRLDDSLLPPPQILASWAAEADLTRRANLKANNAIASLQTTMRARALPAPTILKGQGVAAFYPDPLSRCPGDIDICLSGYRQALLDSFIRQNGLSIKGAADRSRHFIWQGSEVEIHPRLLDIHSPASRRRLKAVLSLEARTGVSIATADTPPASADIRIPAPEVNLLMLSAHILKHAMGHGVGLRQLCDLAVASRRLTPHVDRALMRKAIDDAGLGAWTNRIYSLLHFHLGLPADALPADGIILSPRKTDPLMRFIVRGGNFGRHPAGRRPRHRGKLSTAFSYIRRAPFSLSIAPREALWSFIGLTRGQFSNL